VKTKKELEREAKRSLIFLIVNLLQLTLYLIALEKSVAFYIIVPCFILLVVMYSFYLGCEIAGIAFLEKE
jgi:hypothetical protein